MQAGCMRLMALDAAGPSIKLPPCDQEIEARVCV